MDELFLSDDPPPTKGRPRWVDAVGLAAVVGVILAVGVLGDRGSRHPAAPAPTTTSTTTSAFDRGTPYERTTTTEPPSTTTTIVRLSPALPFPTHAVLLLNNGSGLPLLVDVDAATATRVSSATWGAVAVGNQFVLPGEGSFQVLPASGRPATTVEASMTAGPQQLLASGPGTFWSSRNGPGEVQMTELDLAGRSTGRKVTVPAGAYVAGVVDAGLVVAHHGSLTLIEVASGRPRDLGTGEVVAARGQRIARQRCLLLRCRLELVDTRTGRSRPIPGLATVNGYLSRGAFSADGRWLAYTLTDENGERLTAVAIDGGRTRTTEPSGSTVPLAFSPDGSVLFSVTGTQLCAWVLETDARHCMDGLSSAGVMEMAAARAR
ncbi:MAG: hypothetical protein JWO68_718 [Actinomycetia bacterium]|nr:hypothetical protein [Actinomycetes bacterium]